mmetsp:Transcript_64383/g.135148  ORF Transcript_64383/g.135148 Transcript_64383/m.135148 type:complete len:190 (+) Transcript_64383:39-608(+)
MGGCESCASSRRKETVLHQLKDAKDRGNTSDLKLAIEKAESCGVDSLAARKHYSELTRQERQSQDGMRDLLKWAMSQKDGVVLFNVIQEAKKTCLDHPDLPLAQSKLAEIQYDECRRHTQRAIRNRDPRTLASCIERAKQMGVGQHEIEFMEKTLRDMTEGLGQGTIGNASGEPSPKRFVATGPPPPTT